MSDIPDNLLVVNDLMTFGAEELADHAITLAKEIREGEYEDNGSLSLQVALGHLMDHVVDIWHLSRMTDKECDGESQLDYEGRCLKIPRLQEGYELVDIDK